MSKNNIYTEMYNDRVSKISNTVDYGKLLIKLKIISSIEEESVSKLLNQIKEEKSSGYNKVEKIVNSIDDLASFSVGTIKENILEECQSYCLENLDKPERRELVMGACKNMADKSYTVSEELFNASVDMIANYIFIMRKALDQPIGAQA